MKVILVHLLAVLAMLFSGATLAEEDGADRGEQGKAKAAEMKEKAGAAGDREARDEAREKSREKKQEKQKTRADKPAGPEKKEAAPRAGKGSEKGQQMREEKSRAWWKFWGEDE